MRCGVTEFTINIDPAIFGIILDTPKGLANERIVYKMSS